MSLVDASFLAQHAALTERAGLADFSDRTQIELSGADRSKFLHNFCTSDIAKLAVGSGCETFITDAKGGILAFVFVFCTPDTLVLETVPGQAEKIIKHLDRYLIREQVEIHDRSQQWAELLLSGPASTELLKQLGIGDVPEQLFGHSQIELAGWVVWVRRVDIAGPHGFLLSTIRDHWAAVKQSLVEAGAVPCSEAAVEAARIEAGTPFYGRDIQDRNLPQELARDSRAISFTKGCYLGQETVARIDALGHVNKTLVGVQFLGQQVPDAGTELRSGDAVVGQVTSATFSPRLNAPLALAYLRPGQNSPGSKLNSGMGKAEVVRLPV